MHNIPEEAVKAAMTAQENSFIDGFDPDIQMKAALTAALPHLPGVGVKALPRAPKDQSDIGWTLPIHLLEELRKEADGWADEISIEGVEAIALSTERRILSALEPSAARELALEALRSAEQFIENGFEFGFIRKPDEGDPALETLPKIKAAIRAISSPDHADAGKVEGDGWKPIESAPKDGTEIIYLTKYGSIGFCRYAVDNINDWFGWWDLQADDEVYPKHWLSRSALPSAPSEGTE